MDTNAFSHWQGVDANHRDKQGLSLLHVVISLFLCVVSDVGEMISVVDCVALCLCTCTYFLCFHLYDINFWVNWVQAAVFNQTEIAFALMDSGANLNYKNAQGNQCLILTSIV